MSGYVGMYPPLRIYSINFNAQPAMNWAAFHQYLADNRDIEGYWNYVPFTYFIKTRLDINDISTRLRPFFPGQYIVAEIVGVKRVQGILPLAAWEWFKTDEDTSGGGYLPPPPPPPQT